MTAAEIIAGRREPASTVTRVLSTLEARAFVVWRRAGLDPVAATVALARELADPALRDLVAAETIGAIVRHRPGAARAFARR